MRQTKVSFCSHFSRENRGERSRARKRRKKKKEKKEKSKKGMDFWGIVWNHVYFGFLGFLVWIIGPLYGFPWFLGF